MEKVTPASVIQTPGPFGVERSFRSTPRPPDFQLNGIGSRRIQNRAIDAVTRSTCTRGGYLVRGSADCSRTFRDFFSPSPETFRPDGVAGYLREKYREFSRDEPTEITRFRSRFNIFTVQKGFFIGTTASCDTISHLFEIKLHCWHFRVMSYYIRND